MTLQAKMEAQKCREDAESFRKEAEALRKQAQPGRTWLENNDRKTFEQRHPG